MSHFILTRIISALFGLLGVVSLVFFLIHMIPGDPIDVMLGESALAADREALLRRLGDLIKDNAAELAQLESSLQFCIYLPLISSLLKFLHTVKPVLI